MANYHREVYQPSFEDGPTYDLQDDEIEDARARLLLLIVIAFLVLASFAGVVWLAYNQGLERGLVTTPAVIDAPETPIRTLPPEDTSGVSYTGLKIYNDPIPPDEEAETSALAQTPPSEASMPQPEPLPVPEQPVETEAPASAPPDPTATALQQPTPAPVQAPAATAASALSGGAVLQVGAYPSELLALEAWENFQAQHSAIVAGLSRDIQRADLGESGIWYRVRVGPYPDEAAASAACESLMANGGNCFVAAP
jgi:cell division septation protein DedD